MLFLSQRDTLPDDGFIANLENLMLVYVVVNDIGFVYGVFSSEASAKAAADRENAYSLSEEPHPDDLYTVAEIELDRDCRVSGDR